MGGTMRGITRILAPGVLTMGLLVGCAAQEEAPVPARDVAAAEDAILENLSRSLGILQEKMVDLAQAMPEDSWDWHPEEGVRSVGQIYSHVAADNYFVAALLDISVPAETQVSKDGETVGAYEARVTARDDALVGLEASWTQLFEAVESSRGRMSENVDLRGNPLTVADLWVRATVHLHEHLGQSIAYARMNGVIPPWNR